MSAETLLAYADVVERLGVSVKTVKRLVYQRKLRVVDLGHRTKRFRPADVDRAVALLAGETPREW